MVLVHYVGIGGNSMMKKVWMFTLILALLLSGCYQKGTVRDTNLFEPYYIAHANIPYADKLNDTQFDRVSEVEQDQYGRRYFSYRTYSPMLQADIEMHIISQMSDGGFVSYYPEDCYMIRLEKNAEFSGEVISAFKERNDWGIPLKKDLMYHVQCSVSKDIVDEETLQSAILKSLDLDQSYGVLSNGLETNKAKDRQIFVVRVFARDKDGKATEDGQFYLVVYQINTTAPITTCQKIERTLNCQEAIRIFRDLL